MSSRFEASSKSQFVHGGLNAARKRQHQSPEGARGKGLGSNTGEQLRRFTGFAFVIENPGMRLLLIPLARDRFDAVCRPPGRFALIGCALGAGIFAIRQQFAHSVAPFSGHGQRNILKHAEGDQLALAEQAIRKPPPAAAGMGNFQIKTAEVDWTTLCQKLPEFGTPTYLVLV